MPLPDYSKFKAEIHKKTKPKSSSSPSSALEDTLGNLPFADMDEVARDCGGHDNSIIMGFDLEITNANGNPHESTTSLLNSSMLSLSDPFYDEEECVTEEEEEAEASNAFNASLNASTQSFESAGSGLKSTTSRRRIHRRQTRPSPKDRLHQSASNVSSSAHQRTFLNNLPRHHGNANSMSTLDFEFQASNSHTPISVDNSSGNPSRKSTGKLGDFLDRSSKGRRKTALLPGSRTEDLMEEMKLVVSSLSVKRGGWTGTNRGGSSQGNSPAVRTVASDRGMSASGGGRLRDYSKQSSRLRDYSQSGGGGSTRRSTSKSPGSSRHNRRLRDYSQSSGGGSTRRSTSKSPGPSRRTPKRTASSHSSVRRTASDDTNEQRSCQELPPRCQSADGSTRMMPRRTQMDPTHANGFLTGSRIWRIQPGGGANKSLGGSFSNLSQESSLEASQRLYFPSNSNSRSSRSKSRSISPRRIKSRRDKKQTEGEVPPLVVSQS